MVVYKNASVSRSGRRSKASNKAKTKRIDHIVLELCVILMKTKVVARDTPRLVTVCLTEFVSNSSQTIKKRRPEGFTFKAKDLSITLHAPIEVLERPTSKVTCVPISKTNK